jgi:hypothetical protein
MKDIRVLESQIKIGMPCGKNRAARDARIGKRETGQPKTRWADTFKGVAGVQ